MQIENSRQSHCYVLYCFVGGNFLNTLVWHYGDQHLCLLEPLDLKEQVELIGSHWYEDMRLRRLYHLFHSKWDNNLLNEHPAVSQTINIVVGNEFRSFSHKLTYRRLDFFFATRDVTPFWLLERMQVKGPSAVSFFRPRICVWKRTKLQETWAHWRASFGYRNWMIG